MRRAVITANIGGFDTIKGIPKQIEAEFNFHYYNETNLPFPLPNLENRLKSKYIKLQMHRFLPQYEEYIWLDASIEVKANTFVKTLIEALGDYDVTIYKHMERKSVYEEMAYINHNMKTGNKYLLSRYGDQQLKKEIEFYKSSHLPNDAQLFSTFIFARKNNPKVNAAFDDWWRRIIEFSNFDQTMFSLIAWQHELNVNPLEYDTIRTYKLYEKVKHKNGI